MFIMEVTFDSNERVSFHLAYLDDCANVTQAFLASPDVVSVYTEKVQKEEK